MVHKNTELEETLSQLNKAFETKMFFIDFDTKTIQAYSKEEGEDISISKNQDGTWQFAASGYYFISSNIVADTLDYINNS